MPELLPPDAALFHRDGPWLVPSELTQGFWNPEAQHGGAVCAALAWAIEQEPAPVPMRAVRIGFDLMHPAPIQPLRIQAGVARAGRRVQLVDVALLHGERVVARAGALRVRVDAAQPIAPESRGEPEPPLALRPDDLEQTGTPRRFAGARHVPGFSRAAEVRRQKEPPRNGEPVRAWSRLHCPVVAGEVPSPIVRLAAISDFVSGIANGLDLTRFVSINPDVTLHVERLPEGEWIGIEAVTRLAADGVGFSRGTLHDLRGPVGSASTALYVAPR